MQPMRMTCCWQGASPHMPCEPNPNMLSVVDRLQMRVLDVHTLLIRLTRAP